MNAPFSLDGDLEDCPSSPIPIPPLTPALSPNEGEPWLAESNRKPFQATPRKWLVHNLVRDIHRGGSVWGLPGQGKGLFMVFLSLCLLYGMDVNGKRTRRVERSSTSTRKTTSTSSPIASPVFTRASASWSASSYHR